jgi:hypothetical protein
MTDVKKEQGLLSETGEDQNPVGAETRLKVEETIVPGEKRELSSEQQAELLNTLEARFTKQPTHYRHPEGINFEEVKIALEANSELMWSLVQMEKTGGKPDIIAIEDNAFVFADCSADAPRCNLTYIEAEKMAEEFGLNLMTEGEYRELQTQVGRFDLKISNYLKCPHENFRNEGIAFIANCRIKGRSPYTRNINEKSSITGWRGVLRVPKI